MKKANIVAALTALAAFVLSAGAYILSLIHISVTITVLR